MSLCSNPNCKREQERDRPLDVTAAAPRSGCIRIGLLNNMPDAALEATERQFRALLSAASDEITVRLSLYALDDVPRSKAGKIHIAEHYRSARDLDNGDLDALIVTGAEPRTKCLIDEPYWDELTQVIEWARDHTHSTVFSCLAAHAAVLHLDGIERRKSDEKHFGVYQCSQVSKHKLTAEAQEDFALPHSRWNDISESELSANGYSVLTRSPEVGVDLFIKQNKSLFVFFQGHPEYEADTLLREYRRDAGRYLKGERDTYPSLPKGYFDEDTERALDALRIQAMQRHREELLTSISTVLGHGAIDNTWRSTAACIFRNWLHLIRDRKDAETRRRSANLFPNALEANPLTAPSALTQIQIVA